MKKNKENVTIFSLFSRVSNRVTLVDYDRCRLNDQNNRFQLEILERFEEDKYHSKSSIAHRLVVIHRT